MEKMNDLRDLLNHEVQDLISAEDQIIRAMPAMIEKAQNPELVSALKEHLQITEKQRKRLDQVQEILQEGAEPQAPEKKGILARLFSGGATVCKGMQGVIEEGQKIMKEDMNPEVKDAAIVACAQKIEHYEICGYGTARAFARELNLTQVANLLEETLNEEYEADRRMTQLAVGRLNEAAEHAEKSSPKAAPKEVSGAAGARRSSGSKTPAPSENESSAKAATSGRTPEKAAPAKGASRTSGSSAKRATAKKTSKAAPKKAAAKSAGRSSTSGESR